MHIFIYIYIYIYIFMKSIDKSKDVLWELNAPLPIPINL